MFRSCRIAATLIVLLAAAFCENRAWARVYAPRVVSPHNADAYSMRTFAEFPRWRGLKGDALAWEVYKYLVDTRTGVFHMNEVLEGQDVLSEYQTVRDPVKILNVYGYGYCAIFGPVMAGICEGVGIGPARTLVLPGWSHVVAEAFYGGDWHYLDLDVRAVFRRPDGSLASMADARRDPSLWTKRGPLFFPNDRLESARKIYETTPVHHYYGYGTSGHTMDFVLRQGETFTRWWKPQGGRWSHPEVYNREEWLRKLIEQEPRGPKPNHWDFTIHNHGNGRFVYRPNLTARSSDFADGVYDARNVRPGANGLTLMKPGAGYAVFEVRTPYVIVPLVGRVETTEDDREASVVRMDASGASLAISLDNGITWKSLAVGTGTATVDLTPYVSGRYGYLLKIGLAGAPGRAVVRSLSLTTWVQIAPAALPSLRRGVNRMELRAGDHYGLDSRVVEIRPNGGEPKDLLKYCVEPPRHYDPGRKTSRIRGAFVVRAAAPPGAKIAWLSAGGSFETYQGPAARNTHNTMAYAADRPEGFQEIFRSDVPADQNHWHHNADREVRLKSTARQVFVRYVGAPAVNNIRLFLHCVEDAPRPPSPVRIRHQWREGGTPRTRSVTLQRPGPYTITCAGEPEDELIEMAVPSR